MHQFYSIFFVFLLFMVNACKPVTVSHSVDFQAPLGEFETFHWLPGIAEQASELEQYLDQELFASIQRQIAKEMILKGYKPDAADPDIYVNIEIITPDKRSPVNATSSDYVYWAQYDQDKRFPVGSLVIELYNSVRKKVLWQGVAEDFLHEKPKKNQRKIEDAVIRVFKSYENKIFI